MKETRQTIQREIVFQTVKEMKNHPTAEFVFKKIQKKYPSLSKATVYRNLKILARQGRLKHIEMPDSADRFDHFTANHYHMKCTVCSKVCDMDMPYFDKISQFIKDTKGFDIQTHELVFKGICPDCKNKKRRI